MAMSPISDRPRANARLPSRDPKPRPRAARDKPKQCPRLAIAGRGYVYLETGADLAKKEPVPDRRPPPPDNRSEKSGKTVGAIAAKGLKNPGALTKSEIRSHGNRRGAIRSGAAPGLIAVGERSSKVLSLPCSSAPAPARLLVLLQGNTILSELAVFKASLR
jgi:hypothetical protein